MVDQMGRKKRSKVPGGGIWAGIGIAWIRKFGLTPCDLAPLEPVTQTNPIQLCVIDQVRARERTVARSCMRVCVWAYLVDRVVRSHFGSSATPHVYRWWS